MAKNSRPKFPSFISPRGVFVFPKLTEPDYGSKDFPKPDGEYSLKLRMTQADADAFVIKPFGKEGTTLQSLYDQAMENAEEAFKELKVESRKKLGSVQPNPLYSVIYDEETEEPTGEVEFKFKMKASGEFKKGPKAGKRWNRSPDLFDARGNKIKAGVNIWGGSEGKVSFSVGTNKDGLPGYFVAGTAAAGLTLQLNGVQVIELVTNGQRSASSYGFGEEDGYEFDPEDVADQDDGGSEGGDDAADKATQGEEDF